MTVQALSRTNGPVHHLLLVPILLSGGRRARRRPSSGKRQGSQWTYNRVVGKVRAVLNRAGQVSGIPTIRQLKVDSMHRHTLHPSRCYIEPQKTASWAENPALSGVQTER